ncbi:hypothetical protein KIPB_006605, partial [Kipferlia bialata]
DKSIMGALLAGLINFSILTSISFMYPYIYQYAFAYEPGFVGAICSFSPICQFLYSLLFQGKLLQKYTTWAMRIIGLCIMFVGLIGCSLAVPYAGSKSTIWIPVFCIVVMSLGNSTFIGGNNTHMMSSAPIDVKGVMGGAIQTFRETGFALGISLSCLIRDSFQDIMWPYPIPNPNIPIPPDFLPVYVEVFQFSIAAYMQVLWLVVGLTFISGLGAWEMYKALFPGKIYRARHAKFYKGLEKKGITPEQFKASTRAKLKTLNAAKAAEKAALKARQAALKGKPVKPQKTKHSEARSLLGAENEDSEGETKGTQYT